MKRPMRALCEKLAVKGSRTTFPREGRKKRLLPWYGVRFR